MFEESSVISFTTAVELKGTQKQEFTPSTKYMIKIDFYGLYT